MSSYLLDANIILRLLTGEPENHYEAAKAFLEIAENGNRQIYIEPLVMAEVIFVLTGKVYELDRKLVTKELQCFLTNPKLTVINEPVMKLALDKFAASKLDFVDCYLLASSQIRDTKLATFDKGIANIQPETVNLLKPSV